jgi:hypothetical protein
MHAWEQPAGALSEWSPKAGVQLVMPRLGEPVEPAHTERVKPWWRAVDKTARAVRKVIVLSVLHRDRPLFSKSA